MDILNSFRFYVAIQDENKFMIEKYNQDELKELLNKHLICSETKRDVEIERWLHTLDNGGLFNNGYGLKIRIVGKGIMKGAF